MPMPQQGPAQGPMDMAGMPNNNQNNPIDIANNTNDPAPANPAPNNGAPVDPAGTNPAISAAADQERATPDPDSHGNAQASFSKVCLNHNEDQTQDDDIEIDRPGDGDTSVAGGIKLILIFLIFIANFYLCLTQTSKIWTSTLLSEDYLQ